MSDSGAQRANPDSSTSRPFKSNQSKRNDSSDGEEEPWDQRERGDGKDNATSRRRPYEYQPRQSGTMKSRIFIDDDGNLDDGDLPSLSSRVVNKVSHNNSQTPPAASNLVANNVAATISANSMTPVPITPSPQYAGHKQPAWNTPDRGENKPIQQRTGISGFTEEESGPHDEMAARQIYRTDKLRRVERSNRRESRNRKGGYTSDSEDSTDYINRSTATFETESFDEDDRSERSREIEEEYDQSFCGQTLNALGDFCGVLGAASNSPKKTRIADEKNRQRGSGPNMASSEQVQNASHGIRESSAIDDKVVSEKTVGAIPLYSKLVHDRTEESLGISNSVNERNQIFRRNETDQENTAIEVEFVESPDLPADRKNAYLNALAKKAKDDYEEKLKERQRIEQALSTDSNSENPVSLEQTIPMNRTGSDAKSDTSTKSEEDIYNNMSATEKRKFLKYINSGLSPYEANMKVLSERREKQRADPSSTGRKSGTSDKTEVAKNNNVVSKNKKISVKELKNDQPATRHAAKSKVMERAKEAARRFSVWKRVSRSSDSEDTSNPKSALLKARSAGEDSNDSTAAIVKDTALTISNGSKVREEKVIVSSTPIDYDAGKLPFKNSGISYYDGAQRDEVNFEDEKLQSANVGHNTTISESIDRLRSLQSPASFPSKGNGFEELKDSDDGDDAFQPEPAAIETFNTPILHNGYQETSADAIAKGSGVVDSITKGNYKNQGSLVTQMDASQQEASAEAITEASGIVVDSIANGNNENQSRLVTQVYDSKQVIASVAAEVMDEDVDSRTAEANIPLSICQYPIEQGFAHLDDEPPSDEDIIKSHFNQTKDEALTKQPTPEPNMAIISPGLKMVEEKLGTDTSIHGPPAPRPSVLENAEPQTSSDKATKILESSQEKNTRSEANMHKHEFLASDTCNDKNLMSTPENGRTDRDMSIEAYFSATAAISPIGVSSSRDGMSVYTMGTNITGGSTYSHSTRTRRPGAAKARLAKQKEVENQLGKKSGWQESIKAAAATTNRDWDPKKGWIDYHDPDSEAMTQSFDSTHEKLRIDLCKSFLTAKRNGASEMSPAVAENVGTSVPFPPEWEKERLAMLESSDEHSNHYMTTMNLSPVTERNSSFTVESSSAKSLSTVDSTKPKGWIESMKAASASMAKSGMKWDPVYGWTNIDQNRQRVEEFDEYDDRDKSMISTKSFVSSETSSPTLDGAELARDNHVGGGAPELTTTSAEASVEENFDEPASAAVLQADSKSAMSSVSGSSSMPKGFVDSMKAASAVLANAGMKWDPVHGWTKDVDYHSEPSIEVVTASDRENLVVLSSQKDVGLQEYDHTDMARPSVDKVNHNIASAKAVASMISSENPESAGILTESNPTQYSYSIIGTGSRAETKIIVPDKTRRDDGTSADIPDNVEVDRVQMIEEKEGFAMVCVSPDSILLNQSADVGFPSSTHSENHENMLVDDDGNEIPSIEDVLSSSLVDVVKERVGEEDMELFEEPILRDNVSRRIGNSASPNVQTSSTFSDPNSRDSSFRRGAGPVDIDEVDETWDSDDDKRHSRGWDDGNGNIEVTSLNVPIHMKSRAIEEDHLKGWKSGDLSPPLDSSRMSVSLLSSDVDESRTENHRKWGSEDYRLSHSGNADSRSVISSSAKSTRASGRSTLSKKVPKLERSKRDTSPISRGSPDNGGHSRQSPARATKARQENENTILTLVDEKKEDRVQFDTGLLVPSLSSPEPLHRVKVDNVDKMGEITISGSVERMHLYKSGDLRRYPIDRRIGQHDEDFSASPSVKDRLQEWEHRIEKSLSEDAEDDFNNRNMMLPNEQQTVKGSDEWKSFLGKKVREESEAAVRQSKLNTANVETGYDDNDQIDRDDVAQNIYREKRFAAREDEDTIFQFNEERRGNRHDAGKGYSSKSLDDISDLSPIHHQDDSSDIEPAESEAYGPNEDERGMSSFFQRLSACAAPMMPNVGNTGLGSNTQSHNLDFLRSIPQSAAAKSASRFVSTSFACGRPDVDPIDDTSHLDSIQDGKHAKRRLSTDDEKPRSVSAPRVARSSASSVVSDDFGAKTAYLEALAMKTAVSNPKRRHSASSSVASGATDSSEKWRAFLERKRAAASSSQDKYTRTNSNSEVSRAAEKYAAEKVEEIMLKMSSRSTSAPKNRQYSLDIDRLMDTSGEQYSSSGEKKIARKRGSSVRAAEDLAAARVEAMMAALSTHQLDEGEI